MVPVPSRIENFEPPRNKVAIPRGPASKPSQGRRRSARACEPCRQRKIKCDGATPSCGQCAYFNKECSYEDIKRIRTEKQLVHLSQQVERYEVLLRDLEGEADASTARRIRKALKSQKTNNPSPHDEANDSDSGESVGSLEDVDVVEEDLNRDESNRAAGYFGKSSEVTWMQRLDDDIAKSNNQQHSEQPLVSKHTQWGVRFDVPSGHKSQHQRGVSMAMMNYHLDDLNIPLIDNIDPLIIPPRNIADEYFNAYMKFVHPIYQAIRCSAFTAQYENFLNGTPRQPHQKWLAILNIIFAIGCHHCRLTNPDHQEKYDDDRVFLTRARILSLQESVLFEHTDLQQIQLEFLVAVYLLCLGQVNRASKFSSMALRSALSLGINLRLTDSRIHDASKEARCRLWWAIYSLEHQLTSILGRSSCVGQNICAISLPVPAEEETFAQPMVHKLIEGSPLLCPTLFQPATQSDENWTAACQPCPSLFFYYMVDISLISQAVLNKVYSIEGVRDGSSKFEYRIQKYSVQMDRWLAKLPPSYEFTISNAGPWQVNHSQLDDDSLPFARERVCLAMTYYSSRILLCRPCLTYPHPPKIQLKNEMSTSAKLKAEMATRGLQAACALISILPENIDLPWLARTTPSWSVLHFIMQATTALLLGLSRFSSLSKDVNSNEPVEPSDVKPQYSPLLQATDLNVAIEQTKKALCWIHSMAFVDTASRRAFILCDGFARKIGLALKVDMHDWPSAKTLPADAEGTSRMDMEDLINLEGDAF
ncbi:hypothetical protein N7495_007299 [Penicillium taxi]|uniref:uncharacterized protein n=1 Tax=Penicillium taxi TaxID=168475 RepID=UPI0025450EDA|nr:uncharacterized protein N7495_007299 [Penicillium taxi]KAJ5895608.1 hypothetical protein N7495_007299 [Penicillium taxi]